MLEWTGSTGGYSNGERAGMPGPHKLIASVPGTIEL